jgi:molybdopterin synthase sulfur carrier subunit
MITVKAFGIIAEKIKTSEFTLNEVPNTDTLLGYLHQQYPELQHMKFSIAVNRKQSVGNTAIPHGAEVALLPPFSGG